MAENLFGENTFMANTLENLTTGMYRDAKVIYREYIQNACDSIDRAVREGILNGIEAGTIEIWIDIPTRTVTIEDNGAGIAERDFTKILTAIGGSQKQFDKDKGFRGIGRLCGLGYCATLVFTSSAKGETVENVLTCNAAVMRKMIKSHNSHEAEYTGVDVLNTTTKIASRETADIDSHFFRVELCGISKRYESLLDKDQVKDYLTFVAPVPYRNTFTPRHTIYNHAKSLNVTIDEYSIQFEGETIYKEYKPTVVTSKGEDTITKVDFYDFKDDDGNLVAWLWFGITKFQAVIKKECKERGIRLRKENIQIGDEDALQKLFNEDRGQHYFVGEVFAIDSELIPNSQRDYFYAFDDESEEIEDEDALTLFERLLKSYFNGTLSKVYKYSSTVNSAMADINRANKLAEQIAETQAKGVEVDPKLHDQYETARQKAEKKQKDLAKMTEQVSQKIDSGNFRPADEIIHSIIEQVTQQPPVPAQIAHPTSKAVQQSPLGTASFNSTQTLQKPLRMVSFDKVKEVILRNANTDLANLLIAKIEEEIK
jgi:molecular chaperone HtpG